MTYIIAILISLFAFTINIPLGYFRAGVKKFSFAWFVWVHASIPLIIALRIWLETQNWIIPVNIALAVAGQFTGSYIRKKNIKTK